MEPKFCVNCTHVSKVAGIYFCGRDVESKRDLVTGKTVMFGYLDAKLERSEIGGCGTRGKYFK